MAVAPRSGLFSLPYLRRKMAQDTNVAVSIKSLLEAGAHFGHQTGRWHPRMKRYIFTQRNGIHIIDLQQTVALLARALDFVRQTVADGGTLLFVGTKKQAQEAIQQEAQRCGAFFVNQRWLGGMLTNFVTIQSRIDYLVSLEERKGRGEFSVLPKKEAMKLQEEINRLNRIMGGFKEMTVLPSALFIIDPSREHNAFAEARKMRVPVVAVVDTNCDPQGIDYLIPANDDAIRSLRLIISKTADAVLEGKTQQETEATETLAETMAGEAPQQYTFTPDEEEDKLGGSRSVSKGA